ncbi:NUDIX domain-containing protein, partial [Aerococcus urinaeequi]
IQKPANRKIFEAVGQYLVDPDRPGDFNQAIMDLGSSFETPKKAMPELSPLRDFTMATLTGTTDNYPVKSKKAKAKPVYYQALILQNAKGQVLIEKRTQHKLLNNLWTVPLINLGTSSNQNLSANEKTAFLLAETQEAYGISPIFMRKEIGQVKHVFTHLIWHILLTYGQLKPVDEKKINDLMASGEADYAWVAPHQFEDYAFPTVQMKVWQAYEDYQKDNHHNIK